MTKAQPAQMALSFERPLEGTISVFSAARMAECSMETVRRWCDEGRFPANKVGGRWRIYREQFLRWLASGHNGAA